MRTRIACIFALCACLSGAIPALAKKADRQDAGAGLTAREIVTLVRKVHWDLRRHALYLYEHADPIDLEKSFAWCYGDSPATRIAKVADVRAFLSRYVTGRATQCYQASYFGCTVGEWIGFAGLAMSGPESVAYLQSKVVVLEQTPNRVVADVWEPTTDYISESGVFDEKQYARRLNKDRDKWKSRYTFTRAADGAWLIADRVANFEWECGEGEPEPPPIKDAR